MDIRKLQRAIVDGLEDVKAQNIAVFNTENLSSMFERVIIASGTSNRQTKALASSVRDSVKSRGMQVMATEGEDNGEWIIVDCGAAVAHIMQPAIRDYYHLEEIWGGKSVRIKLGDAKTTLVKASEPDGDAPEARPARKSALTPARQRALERPAADSGLKPAAGRRAPAPKKLATSANRTPAATASRSGSSRQPSAAPVPTVVVKTRQAAPKTAPAKAAQAAKPVKPVKPAKPAKTAKPGVQPAARKSAAGKSTVGKTVARKAPARKTGRSV